MREGKSMQEHAGRILDWNKKVQAPEFLFTESLASFLGLPSPWYLGSSGTDSRHIVGSF